MDGVTAWHDYQQQAAAFFQSLDLEVTIDESVSGARGMHDIDVVVRARRAGIEQLWVVECKHWRKSIDKLHVLALAQIVQDIGADRGILLSETGFQAGAIRVAASSNITLTSLADLHASTHEERADIGVRKARTHLMSLRLGLLQLHCALQIIESDRPELIDALPMIHTAEFGVTHAVLGMWPAMYPALTDGAGWDYETKWARSAAELLPIIESLVSQLEDELSLELASHARVRSGTTRRAAGTAMGN